MIIRNNNSIDIIQGNTGYGNVVDGIIDWRLQNTSAGVFNILNSNSTTSILNIIDNGNIGIRINPTSTSSKLNIFADINISGNYLINNRDIISDTSNYVLSTSNILLANIKKNVWATSNNMIYYNTSNVGIGTTNPTSKLHLYNDNINETKMTIQNIGTQEIIVTDTISTIIGTDRCIQFIYSGVNTNKEYTFTTNEVLNYDILIVGGGGGGGMGESTNTSLTGGGGGAGGVVYMINKTLSIGTYTVVVGMGGSSVSGFGSSLRNNTYNFIVNDSISLEAKGGGVGGYGSNRPGTNGGSGGGGGIGGAAGTATQTNTFWNGTTYVAGGYSGGTTTIVNSGAAGGGAGGTAHVNGLGAGGDGVQVNITGINTYYAGGGNAYTNDLSTTRSKGGGGILNGTNSYQKGGNALPSTGSGGAGGYGINMEGGSGGSGIVIIRYRKVSSLTSTSSIELIGGTQNDSNRDYKIGNYNGDFIVKSSINGADTDYIKITGSTNTITNPTGTTSWTSASDRRIKENIERASYDKCYESINKLELNRFNYINGFNTVNRDITQLGFIAQEVKEIFPKSVFENSYINDTINISDLQSIDITQINYTLYGAVKKLIEIIDDNKKNIKKIENTLNIDIDTISTSNITINNILIN